MPKKSVFGENAKLTTFRLYSWERKLVREFIKNERQKKLKELENDDKKRS